MAKLDAGSTLKRLRNRYRLVVMNDDTYEEVVVKLRSAFQPEGDEYWVELHRLWGKNNDPKYSDLKAVPVDLRDV
jgi:hypothetical protein